MLLEEEIDIQGTRFIIRGEIGEGTVGHVFVVEEEGGRRWALKVIRDYGRNPIIREMVDQEIRMQERFLGNPHIIQLRAHTYPFPHAASTTAACSSCSSWAPAPSATG